MASGSRHGRNDASTLVVGDLHLKQVHVLPCVDELLSERPDVRRVVMLGDACDDWGAEEDQELDALGFYADWVEGWRDEGLVIDVLLGNHDMCYLRGTCVTGTVPNVRRELSAILQERLRVRMATVAGGLLCTHAGLTGAWVKNAWGSSYVSGASAQELAERLNEMLEDPASWASLDSCPPSRGGVSLPGPLWADLRDLEHDPLPGVGQIVGHTPVDSVSLAGYGAAPLWACDTMSLMRYGDPIGDGSMLLVSDDGTCRPVPFPGDEPYEEVAERYWDERGADY